LAQPSTDSSFISKKQLNTKRTKLALTSINNLFLHPEMEFLGHRETHRDPACREFVLCFRKTTQNTKKKQVHRAPADDEVNLKE